MESQGLLRAVAFGRHGAVERLRIRREVEVHEVVVDRVGLGADPRGPRRQREPRRSPPPGALDGARRGSTAVVRTIALEEDDAAFERLVVGAAQVERDRPTVIDVRGVRGVWSRRSGRVDRRALRRREGGRGIGRDRAAGSGRRRLHRRLRDAGLVSQRLVRTVVATIAATITTPTATATRVLLTADGAPATSSRAPPPSPPAALSQRVGSPTFGAGAIPSPSRRRASGR